MNHPTQPTALRAAFAALVSAAGGLAAAGLAALWRMPRCATSPGGYATFTANDISIVIPARNEERRLAPLLKSISRQRPLPREVLVVDDFSEDATAHIARDAGARVVRPDQRPPGWTGKTWACWSGACQARGDVLLFLDADVWFEHEGLRMLLDTFNSAPGALSALPYQHACKPHEHLSAVFVMAMAAGTGAFSPLGGNPAGLFGPCMMCRREDYFLAGGHKAVRSEVLEHLMMGSRFAAAGVPVRLCRGKDAVAVRMYAGGVRELIDGWAKAFASGAAVSSRPGKTLFVLWIVGAVLLSAAMAIGAVRAKSLSGLWRLAAAAYGVHAAVFYRNARLAGAFSPLAALAFPVTILFFIGVFIRSAALASGVGSVRWRGRTISREADA